MRARQSFVLATGLLAGTIIGAGIFSLPYVASRLGLVGGLFYLGTFTVVYYCVHRMYSALLETEDGAHQFAHLAHRYFGKTLGRFASFTILSELIFVMLVYLVLAPTFTSLLDGGDSLGALLAFWAAGSLFIFVRASWMGFADFVGTLAILGIIVIVFAEGVGQSLTTPWFAPLRLETLFLPFGPLLFSLAGRPAIHKMVEICRNARAEGAPFSLPRAVFWGTAIPAFVYVFFVVSVLRLAPAVSPEALDSLAFLSPAILALLGWMGIITLWTSYFMIGVNVRDILHLDLRMPHLASALVVLGAPLLLYAVGFREFLFVLSFVGSVFLALEAVFVILMWRSAFPAHRLRWAALPLLFVFAAAFTYEIVRVLA